MHTIPVFQDFLPENMHTNIVGWLWCNRHLADHMLTAVRRGSLPLNLAVSSGAGLNLVDGYRIENLEPFVSHAPVFCLLSALRLVVNTSGRSHR
jgi:hypothetical protein